MLAGVHLRANRCVSGKSTSQEGLPPARNCSNAVASLSLSPECLTPCGVCDETCPGPWSNRIQVDFLQASASASKRYQVLKPLMLSQVNFSAGVRKVQMRSRPCASVMGKHLH